MHDELRSMVRVVGAALAVGVVCSLWPLATTAVITGIAGVLVSRVGVVLGVVAAVALVWRHRARRRPARGDAPVDVSERGSTPRHRD